MLVGDLRDPLAVQGHGGHGVEPLEDEGVAIRIPFASRELERRLVGPVDEADPRQCRLVVVEIRVGDETRTHQIEMNDARNDGRERGIRNAGRARARSDRPSLVEATAADDGVRGNDGHLTAPATRPL